MNKKIISVIMILALAVSFCGCGKDDKKQALDSTAVNVTITKAERGDVTQSVNYTGEVKAVSVASVSSKVSATVKQIHVDVGDYVKEGDVIMTLDSTQYALAQDQANAAYNSALAAKNSAVAARESAVAMKKSAAAAKQSANAAKEGANAAKEGANAAKQSAVAAKSGAEASYNNVTGGSLEQSKVSMNQAVANAQSAYDTALENYNRQKALYDIGAISEVAFDSAETTLNNAKVALDSAKANANLNENVVIPQTQASANAGVSQADAGISQAEAGISQANAGISQADAGIKQAEAGISQAEAGVTQADAGIKQADAGVNQARVAVDIAKDNLANCIIKAPISGYISSKNFNIGQMAAPGVEAFSIKDTTSLDVEISVTESVIASISKGTQAKIAIKSAKLKDIKGKVTAVGETKNEQTGMFTVKISIPNKGKKIKIGMLADVTLATEKAKKVVTANYDALIQKNNKYYVYVAKNNIAEKREVTVGITDGKKAQITKGIKAGETIILEGKDFLSEKNNRIRIVN